MGSTHQTSRTRVIGQIAILSLLEEHIGGLWLVIELLVSQSADGRVIVIRLFSEQLHRAGLKLKLLHHTRVGKAHSCRIAPIDCRINGREVCYCPKMDNTSGIKAFSLPLLTKPNYIGIEVVHDTGPSRPTKMLDSFRHCRISVEHRP